MYACCCGVYAGKRAAGAGAPRELGAEERGGVEGVD